MSKRKDAGRNVNQAEVARIMGVSLPTIRDWVRKGCPFVQEGGSGRPYIFNTEAVRVWRENAKVKEATSKDDSFNSNLDQRLKIATVERAELELAKEKGLVAPIEEFKAARTEINAKIRARLRMLPAKLALLVIGQTDEAAIRALMAKEIDDILRILGAEALPAVPSEAH